MRKFVTPDFEQAMSGLEKANIDFFAVEFFRNMPVQAPASCLTFPDGQIASTDTHLDAGLHSFDFEIAEVFFSYRFKSFCDWHWYCCQRTNRACYLYKLSSIH